MRVVQAVIPQAVCVAETLKDAVHEALQGQTQHIQSSNNCTRCPPLRPLLPGNLTRDGEPLQTSQQPPQPTSTSGIVLATRILSPAKKNTAEPRLKEAPWLQALLHVHVSTSDTCAPVSLNQTQSGEGRVPGP